MKPDERKWTDRFRNYALWAAVFGFFPILLEALDYNVLPKNYTELWTLFLGILVLAGVINNPSNGNFYKDN